MIAEVIINSNVKNLNKVFDYNIPSNLENSVSIGSRVLVQFGNKKDLEEAFVISIKEKSEYKVKDIIKIEEGIGLTEDNIKLAKLMARRYFCNISDCIKLMLPPGTLTKKIEKRIKEKTTKFVFLQKDEDEINSDIENRIIKSEKQIRVLNFLMSNDEIQINDLILYTDVSSNILKTLQKNGYIDIIEKQVERNPFINKNIDRSTKLKLTEEQEKAFNEINKEIEKNTFKEFLLYGVTGSGKTEIYLQLIEKVLAKNKTAILLVPEISLTPQMVNRFISRFGQDDIAVLHSKLSIGERFDQWVKIKNGESKIVIGARSAILAPLNNIGIIIIDEEHDSSYKSETNPRFNAKEIGKYIAQKENIPIVLGSATPDINSFYKANEGEIKLLKLTHRANNSSLPRVNIVDLRQELANGNRSILSRKLYDEIEENLKNKKQTILFLNRRGYSTFVMCRDCGYTLKCKNCNITMTYHLKTNKLKCHYCGYEQNNISICPECKSHNIKYFGTGTQKLEQEIQKIFPKATTLRMDIDTVSKKNSHEKILEQFKNENVDILIGTQMVVKGHHFPNVTLVGVIAADSSLYIEDYRANERTFQILTQVAGRAGRDKYPGRVVIQTYNPENFAIECAQKQNYDIFYEKEIYLREQLNYPPFCDIIVIGFTSEIEEDVTKSATKVYRNICKLAKEENIQLQIYKPLPSPIDKIKNKYRWRIILKGKINNKLINIINNSIETKNSKVRINVDTNPTNLS